ncbi:MAG: LuxR C-terminal-related transcriptional regulator [Pseudomonadota bacterium]
MKILALTHTQYLSLTQRERQVCDLLAKGHKNIHIGDYLKITAATVKVHKAKVMKKMRVESV